MVCMPSLGNEVFFVCLLLSAYWCAYTATIFSWFIFCEVVWRSLDLLYCDPCWFPLR